jgi:signal transduction histidine kinase
MWKLQQSFSLRHFHELPHFVPGDTRESFLARTRIRKLLLYSRLAAMILMVTGPFAFLFYGQPAGRSLGVFLFGTGVVALFLLPFLAKWKRLQERSEFVAPLLTLFFLVPTAAAVVFDPAQDRGRGFVFLGAAISTFCLSRRAFLLNYLLVALVWIVTWCFAGLAFGAEDAVFCFLAVPIVGYMICALQTDSLVSLFDLHRLAVDQQQKLQQTLQQLTQEIDRRRDEERLLAASRAKFQEQQHELFHVSRLSVLGEMAVGIAHEVRQPLHALSMYAGVLDALATAPEPDREKLQACSVKIGEIVCHTSEVIRGLQNYAGRGAREVAPVSMDEVVRDAVLLTEPEWQRHSVTITVDREECLSLVLANGVQLRQVIVNLLRNSCEAMGSTPVDDRRINLTLRNDDGYVEVRVADTGCGFTIDQQARLFETFFTTKDDGLGMGMSISRRIVEEYRGTLELLPDERPGATFLIRLPVLDTDTTAPAIATATEIADADCGGH